MIPVRGSTARKLLPWRSRMKTVPSAATLTARAPNTPAAAGGAAVAGMRRLAGAGKGRDRAARQIDDAHPVVGDIGDEQPLLRRIECQPVGLDHPARAAGPPSPANPALPLPATVVTMPEAPSIRRTQ